MANDWILDVIKDLWRFADMNDLPQLSKQLALAAEVAEREMAAERVAPAGNGWEAHAAGVERIFGLAAGRDA